MLKRALTVAAVGALLGAVPVVSSPAAAATNHRGGITISTPDRKTVYNHSAVNVAPSIHVNAGIHKSVTGHRITAWSGSKKVSSGSHVHLRIGTYRVQTTVTYRTFKYVTRTRTVSKFHPGGMPDNSSCTVTSVYDFDGDGVGDEVKTADCTNSTYPGQTVHESDPLDNATASSYKIGDKFRSDYIEFKGYYTSTKVPYSVKMWTGRGSVSTPKHRLTVVDGGYRIVYSDSESLTTSYFSVPDHWAASYSYDCSSFGQSGNWIVDLHQRGHSVLDDVNLDNVIRHYGAGTYRFSGAGTFRFEVITECDWEIIVHWR